MLLLFLVVRQIDHLAVGCTRRMANQQIIVEVIVLSHRRTHHHTIGTHLIARARLGIKVEAYPSAMALPRGLGYLGVELANLILFAGRHLLWLLSLRLR